MELTELTAALVALGCPSAKAPEMAAQMHKRALQLATQKSTSYETAMMHLLQLMRQGWAAKERGIQ